MNGPGMKTYLAVFLIAAFAAVASTPLLRRWCERRGLVDRQLGGRRIHQKAVPRLGGIAIFSSVILALLSLTLVNNALTQNLRPELKPILSVLVCSLLVLLLGVYDDIRGVNASIKLIGLGCIAVLFYGLGGRIDGLSIPFVGQVVLHPVVGFVFTLVW